MLLIYKMLLNVKDLSSIGSKMQIVKQNLLESSHSYICTPNRYFSRTSYMLGAVNKHRCGPVLMESDKGDKCDSKDRSHESHRIRSGCCQGVGLV